MSEYTKIKKKMIELNESLILDENSYQDDYQGSFQNVLDTMEGLRKTLERFLKRYDNES
jgi:hypothetical protein